MSYVGRFAPTPSGPLHFGSLVAALGGWLDARHHHGQFLLRIEDVDTPRCPPGIDSQILKQLEAFGLYWDGDVRFQSERSDAYQSALDQLLRGNMAYPCGCSRQEWRDFANYPGWCREKPLHPERAQAYRLRMPQTGTLTWQDRALGSQTLAYNTTSDVVIKRKDALWAYQLAVVVDDADQGVTDVVRGFDLLDNTPWQIELQRALNLPKTRYLHLPLIMGEDGQKLSKQNLAQPIPTDQIAAAPLLHQALTLLGQSPILEPKAPIEDQLQAALSRWNIQKLPRSPHITF